MLALNLYYRSFQANITKHLSPLMMLVLTSLLRIFGGIIDKRLTSMLGFSIPLSNVPLPQCYRRTELEKKQAYEPHIREIEFGSFSPLVFSTTGGLGSTATVVFKRLASLIADKQEQPYSKTLFWLRCKLSFSLLRSAVMCFRDSRSSYTIGHNIFLHHPLTLQLLTARSTSQQCNTSSLVFHFLVFLFCKIVCMCLLCIIVIAMYTKRTCRSTKTQMSLYEVHVHIFRVFDGLYANVRVGNASLSF